MQGLRLIEVGLDAGLGRNRLLSERELVLEDGPCSW